MLATATFNKDRMAKAAIESFVNATDMAEYLVKKGCPFRDAHFIVGKLVKDCIDKKLYLSDLSLQELSEASEYFEEDIYKVLNVRTSLENKKMTGSPNPEIVRAYLDEVE